MPILGLLPGFLRIPWPAVSRWPSPAAAWSGPRVRPGGGHRLHQGLQVTADVGRACQQAGAPVLETPAGEVLPAGDVGPPSVGEPAAGLRPGVARTLTPAGEVGAPSDASGGNAGVPRGTVSNSAPVVTVLPMARIMGSTSQKAHYVAVRLQNFIGVYALLGKSLLAPLSAAIDALSPITRPTLPQSFL